MARGIISGYRVHVAVTTDYSDHNVSRKLEFNATNKWFLRLRALWSVREFVKLAVEGRSSVGYNDSLHLSVVHVPHFADGLYSSFQAYSFSLCWFASASLANPYCQSMWISVCVYVCMSVCPSF